MAGELFPGIPVFFNGKKYLIPSLSLRQVQDNLELLTAPLTITEASLSEHFDRYRPIIGSAIRRNYPAVSDEELRDWLGINTFYQVLAIVKGASGLKEVEPGE